MTNHGSLIHISQLKEWDVIQIPAHALDMKGREPTLAYVSDIFYEGDTIKDLTLYPIVPRQQAAEQFAYARPVELTQTGPVGIPPDSVLVPSARTVLPTSHNLRIRDQGRNLRRFGREDDGLVVRMGAFAGNHPDMDAIFAAVETRDDRPRRKIGDTRTLNWEKVEGAREIGSLARKEVLAEEEALRPKRVYNRKTDAKKPARKKQGASVTIVYDLTMDEIASTFDISNGLKKLFNALAANPETASLTLRELQTVADKVPHMFEQQGADRISIETVASMRLVEQGGVVGTAQLLKFLNGLRDTPMAGKAFNTLATMDRSGLYALPGIGPRNITPVVTEIAAAKARIDDAVASRALLDPKAIAHELKSIRSTFMTQAMAISAGTADSALLEKYQDPATKIPGQTPVYFHAKVLKV